MRDLPVDLADADLKRRLIATWDGTPPYGHATNRGFSGDYSEAFTIESGFTIDDQVIADQQQVIAALAELFEAAKRRWSASGWDICTAKCAFWIVRGRRGGRAYNFTS